MVSQSVVPSAENVLSTKPATHESVLVAITNYEFNDNALKLKEFLSASYKTIIIDSSSPGGFEAADIIIENRRYPGLWDEAVKQAIENDFQWLFFVASDLQFLEATLLQECIVEVIRSETINLWTPSIALRSRFSFKSCASQLSSGMRLCGAAEGFCFLARTSMLAKLYPLPADLQYGYGIDIVTALYAHESGLAVVDDRVIVYHPPRRAEHSLDESDAQREYRDYRKQFVFDQAVINRIDSLEQKAANGVKTATILPTRSLDLGCGNALRNPLGANEVFGVDIANQPPYSVIRRADLSIEPIPFADNEFDYVTAYDFIEHVPRVIYLNNVCRFAFVELMNEIFRVLRPGGIFLSLTPAFPHPEAFQDPTHVNIITEKTLPNYFCRPYLWSGMYGFHGDFVLVHQSFKEEGKLLTIMRSLKSSPNH